MGATRTKAWKLSDGLGSSASHLLPSRCPERGRPGRQHRPELREQHGGCQPGGDGVREKSWGRK